MNGALGVIFAGGGSGGHLYPGIAIAERLPERADAMFVCSDRAIDRAILAREARPFSPSPAAPLSVRPRGLVRFLGRWGQAVRHGRSLIRDLKAQQKNVVVVAVGGFVAAPVIQAARAERVPRLMLNLDAVPGKANRWIARHATRVLTAYQTTRQDPWELVPPIVRSKALAPENRQACRNMLGLEPDRPTLFVTGASQGAGSMNQLLESFVQDHQQQLVDDGWQVLHQAGARADLGDLQSGYDRVGVPAKVVDFVDEIGLAWGSADLAVARAAAGTVSEARINRVPTVFLPYPYHKDQHQRWNAQPLADADAAVLVVDRVDPARTMPEFAPRLSGLLHSAEKRDLMRKSLIELDQSAEPSAGPLRVVQMIEEIASIR